MTRHVVQRIAFDFEVATQSDALSVQDRLSSFRLNKLDRILEDCFAEVAQPPKALQLGRLDLDLGDLPHDGMEVVLAQRLRGALRSALLQASAEGQAAVAEEEPATSPAAGDLAALALYLQYGQLHWSLGKGSESLDRQLADAIARTPERLRLLLQQLGVQASVRRRLAYQAGDEVIERLAGLLDGGSGETLARLARGLRQIHSAHPVTGSSPASFALQVRAALLETLLATRSAAGSEGRADSAMLQYLAETTGLRRDDLLDALRDRARLLPDVDGALRSRLDALALHRQVPSPIPAGELARALKTLPADAESLLEVARRLDPALAAGETHFGPRQAKLAEALLELATQAEGREIDEGAIVERLTKALSDAPGALPSPSETEPAGAPVLDRFESFLYLLRHGTASASDAASATRDMAAWVDELLTEDAPRLLSALREMGEHPATVGNLLRQLPWSALEKLILRLAPEIGGLVATSLLAADLAARELLSPRGGAVYRAVWRTALGRLLDPHAPKPDAQGFLTAMVHETAVRTGESQVETLALLLSGARAGEASAALERDRFSPLVDLLSGIVDRMPEERPAVLEGRKTASGEADLTAITTDMEGPGPFPFEEPPRPPETEAEPPALERRLVAFLRYGTLPPGDTTLAMASLQAELLAGLRKGEAELHELLRAAARAPLPRARLVHRLTAETLRSLLRQLHPSARELLSLLDALAPALARLAPGMTAAEWSAIVFDELLIAVGETERGRRFEAKAVLRAVLQRVAQRSRRLYPALLAALSVRLARTGPAGSRAGTLLDELTETAWVDSPPVAIAAARDESTALQEETREPAAGLTTYVDNAGLVLLWPFLTRYFTILGLLDDTGFRSMTAQVRAVHLTEFLASGEGDVPEHRLALNKVLCGLTAAVPTDRDFEPSADELELSENLLRGVTQSWAPLNNTSIATLRETFLQREGRLSRDGSDAPLTLHVESKAYDMLLDRLPWSISVVRLSFMTEALHVSWR